MRVTGRTIALRYIAFAGLSIGINLGVQALSLALYRGPYAAPIAMLSGTAAGLLVKYVLDRRWIFAGRSGGAVNDLGQFARYGITGGATTLLFWGVETAFAAVSPGGSLRLLGGFIGLSIGYVVKYRLDRRYVFAPERARTEGSIEEVRPPKDRERAAHER